MDAFELSAKLALNSQSFEKGMKNAESGFRSFGSKLASLGGKAVSAYTAVTSSAIAVLGKKSVDAYANYEQLVGGVETLFKKSAKQVQEYASVAYKTAGISANKYMEISTSFAASLVKNLRGDTARAADLADMAMQDMSDNANKMGTDFDSIQHAYQGFAKQNYTMLDNLKLGYGGTKTEMQRLLKDAEKLTGKKYDISNFADIVEAIHAIQTEMGITGTTAEEAEKTISGSLNMVKASWEDLLVAMADPKASKGEAIKKFTDSVKVMLKNTMPAFKNFMSGLGDVISEIAPIIGEELPDLIAEFAPKFLEAGKNLMVGLGKGVIKAAQKIKWPTWNDVRNGVNKAWKGITQGVEMLGGIVFGKNVDGSIKWPTWNDVGSAIEAGWNTIVSGVEGLAKVVFGTNVDGTIKWPTWDDVGQLITSAWNLIKGGVEGLAKIIFGTNVDGSIKWPTWDDVGQLITSAWNLIKSGVEGLAKIVFGENVDGSIKWPTWDDIGQLITDAWNTIKTSVGQLAQIVFGTNVDGSIKWPTWDDVGQLITSAWNTLTEKVSQLGKIVFGTNVDGSIKWPTWDDIGQLVTSAWNTIIDNVLLLGKIVFGTNVDGTIKWPTWDDIGQAITAAWNNIKLNVSTLAGIVFGTNVDGTIQWPTWESIGESITTAWNDIKEKIGSLAKIIFGENVDGSINWPTWDTIGELITAAWETIKTNVAALGKIVFGENVDGTINWPTWDGIGDALTEAWNYIIAQVGNLAKLVFGTNVDGTINWPTWSSISTSVTEDWNEIVAQAKNLKTIIFGDTATAASTFDSILLSWSNLHDTIVGNAINIGTYFFDTGDPTVVSTAIKGVADAIVPIAAALGTAAVVTNFGKMINNLKALFQLDVGYSKTAIILAGIAAAFTLVAQHWDDIKPVLDEIGAWFQEKIVKPVQEAIDAIKEFFGIKPPSGAFITEQKGAELLQMYKDWQNSGNIFGGRDQNKLNQFYSSLESAIKEAGYSEAEISRIMQDVRNPHSGKNAEDVINSLIGTGEAATGAAEEVNILQEALDGVTGDYPVNIPINVTGGGGVLDHLPNGRRKMIPKAKGDWSVPYDNFPALLHRNEMVLTASQARQYRDGTANSGLTAADVANIARSAVSNLTMEMNNETVGRVFGDSTTRRVNDNIMHMNRRKRYGYGG